MAKKHKKLGGFLIGGEIVRNGRVTFEYFDSHQNPFKVTLTRTQAKAILEQDNPFNFPPEEGW